MKRQLVLAVLVLTVILVGVLAGREALGGSEAAPLVNAMPAPGHEDVPEMIVVEDEEGAVSSSMPVPSHEDAPEMIVVGLEEGGAVSSGMPVPGFEGIEEHLVIEE